MVDRYKNMFALKSKKGEGAFIPFTIIGDPDIETSYEFILDIIESGADALELGLPFSDPVADGPIIQKSAARALKAGAKIDDCLNLISRVRIANPDIPIGLLVYANLVIAKGLESFFTKSYKAGVDSVLIADVPANECKPFQIVAKKHGIKLVLILPMDSDMATIKEIASRSEGYLYLLSRRGVTGVENEAGLPDATLINTLQKMGSAPPVLGFGISNPGQVISALKAGCKGVITGSAIVKFIAEIDKGLAKKKHLTDFIRSMKAATRGV